MKQRGFLAALVLLFAWRGVAAHELWLEPLKWQAAPDTEIRVAILLGTGMQGSQQIYMPASFRRFEQITPSGSRPVTGRMGDRPAGNLTAKGDGLNLFVYETTPRLVQYDHLDDFAAFARKKGYPEAEDQHRSKGLPETSFVERYTRHAKSLISIGTPAAPAAGEDRRLGLEVEFIARENPYRWQAGPLVFALEVDGMPRPDAQVTVMYRQSGIPDAAVTEMVLRTDAKGMIGFTPRRGYIYLLDHVDLAAATREEADGARWISRWGSLTFLVPDA
ncbi:DUF4198 domain-containing protein [Alphaproteobacteria bacterium LSUCC0684]